VEISVTNKQLQSLTRDWQRRLRLQDWDVKVEWAPYQTIEGDGRTRYNAALKLATIEICTPETALKQYGNLLFNPEQVLIHELLHLHFPRMASIEDPKYDIMETAVDCIAWALLQAKTEVPR